MTLEALRASFALCGSLHEAILLGLRVSPSWEVADVIIQDEFTHDVVFMARPDGPALVLDCT
jgi:hypothetical protein